MTDNDGSSRKNWWVTLPGLITALATLIGAITTLYLAISPHDTKPDPCKSSDPPFYCFEEK